MTDWGMVQRAEQFANEVAAQIEEVWQGQAVGGMMVVTRPNGDEFEVRVTVTPRAYTGSVSPCAWTGNDEAEKDNQKNARGPSLWERRGNR